MFVIVLFFSPIILKQNPQNKPRINKKQSFFLPAFQSKGFFLQSFSKLSLQMHNRYRLIFSQYYINKSISIFNFHILYHFKRRIIMGKRLPLKKKSSTMKVEKQFILSRILTQKLLKSYIFPMRLQLRIQKIQKEKHIQSIRLKSFIGRHKPDFFRSIVDRIGA